MYLYTPSYKSGYARNAAESDNPGLWKGLVGLWMPGLGPTGLELRDISGYGNHGTLTNMDPTDWVMTEKGWATQSGATESVEIAISGVDVPVRRWSCAFDIDIVTVGSSTYWQVITAADQTPSLRFRSNERFYIFTNTTNMRWDIYTYSPAAMTGRFLYVVTYDGTNGALWRNGILLDLKPATDDCSWGTAASLCKTSAGDGEWVVNTNMITVWDHVIAPSEIQQLYEDPDALVRQRIKIFQSATTTTQFMYHLSMSGLTHIGFNGGLNA